MRSFVLTGLRRSLSTTPVGEVADFDELPTRDSSGLSSVHRLTIGFNPRRPKARCAGLMLRRETAQIFSPSSRTRDGKPLMPMKGIGIRSAACAGTPFPTSQGAQPDRLGDSQGQETGWESDSLRCAEPVFGCVIGGEQRLDGEFLRGHIQRSPNRCQQCKQAKLQVTPPKMQHGKRSRHSG